jgi:CheY-like chemotaxis protein
MRQGHRSQARVLVADWDRNNALSLTSIMHRAGFKTAVAFNGKEAVEKAETFRPDLVVTEAYLGRLSGIHAAARILAAFPDCKFLFLSSEASDADIARGAPEGLIYSYTPKPIHPLNLLNAISYLLSAEWCTSDSTMAESMTPNPGAAGTAGDAGETATATQTRLPAPIYRRHYFSAPD